MSCSEDGGGGDEKKELGSILAPPIGDWYRLLLGRPCSRGGEEVMSEGCIPELLLGGDTVKWEQVGGR